MCTVGAMLLVRRSIASAPMRPSLHGPSLSSVNSGIPVMANQLLRHQKKDPILAASFFVGGYFLSLVSHQTYLKANGRALNLPHQLR